MVDSKIYVIGGYNESGGYLHTVEVYDPKEDSWEILNPMPTARADWEYVLLTALYMP